MFESGSVGTFLLTGVLACVISVSMLHSFNSCILSVSSFKMSSYVGRGVLYMFCQSCIIAITVGHLLLTDN